MIGHPVSHAACPDQLVEEGKVPWVLTYSLCSLYDLCNGSREHAGDGCDTHLRQPAPA